MVLFEVSSLSRAPCNRQPLAGRTRFDLSVDRIENYVSHETVMHYRDLGFLHSRDAAPQNCPANSIQVDWFTGAHVGKLDQSLVTPMDGLIKNHRRPRRAGVVA